MMAASARPTRSGSPARASSTCCSCSAPTNTTLSAMGKAFVVYVGTHGDAGAHRADVILPARRLHRKDAAPTSTPRAGCRSAERAVFPPGEAKEDWAIFRALSARARQAAAVQFAAPSCARRVCANSRIWRGSTRSCRPRIAGRAGRSPARAIKTESAKLHSPIGDFYLTNPIARASAMMARMLADCRPVSSRRRSNAHGLHRSQRSNYLLGIPFLGWGDAGRASSTRACCSSSRC